MTESKHTPGPWKANFDDYTKSVIDILNENKTVIAMAPDQEVHQGDRTILSLEEIEANVHLIAAAPDMYEALEEVVALVCDSCLEYERFKELCYGRQKVVIAENPCNNCTNKVIKALRKARGETE